MQTPNSWISTNSHFFCFNGRSINSVPLHNKGWFSLAHKHSISISKWEHPRHKRISSNIRRTNPLIRLMLFSLAHKHKHKHISISISTRKTNMFVFLVLMLMLVRKWEQHKTNKWVRSSAYAYAYVEGVLTCLCLCHAYACAYVYALVRTSLNGNGHKSVSQLLKQPLDEHCIENPFFL